MNSKTRQLCDQIRRKVKSNITGEAEFKHNDDIIEAAIVQFYNALKKEKHL
jgi:hypothetical protein|tara:strand:+ start:266 stop:418 length:153 start_codon:yes stop_codon:yes gene_type:complete